MLLDLGEVQLDLLHVAGISLEQHVLHAQQHDGLDQKLEPLALPVLEGSAEESGPELVHLERLPMLA